ncbi:MAG TPA: tautomerase family protein [Hyphomicrobiaceae bacterium]|jgi:4-oxalocrotonate tautomerase
MPEVYVHAVEGRTLDQKRMLVKEITDAVVKNFNVKPEAVLVQIVESSKESKARAASCSATVRRASTNLRGLAGAVPWGTGGCAPAVAI